MHTRTHMPDDRSSTKYQSEEKKKKKGILCSHTMQIDHRRTNEQRTMAAIAYAHYDKTVCNK